MRPTIVFLALLVVCLAGCQDRPAGNGVAATTTTKTYTRDEFRKLVVGKTPDEVIAAVGRPDSTQDSGRDPTWYYDSRTRDPVSGKIDFHAQVIFQDGKVVRVNY